MLQLVKQMIMTTDLDSDSVAHYLAHHPEFFQVHSELLAQINLTSPLNGRAVSLAERQMEVMRSKYKALELKLAELVRLAQENDAIANKFHAWTQSLLLARNDVDLPHILIDGLRTVFNVPFATLRLWNVAAEYSHTWFVQDASEDAKIFATCLFMGNPFDISFQFAPSSIVSQTLPSSVPAYRNPG